MPYRPNRLAWTAGIAVITILVVALLDRGPSAGADKPNQQAKTSRKQPAESEETIDPLSVNATCYVCHMAFVREAISRVHFKKQITCIKCHGLSAAHANDENIGATKPDTVYTRGQVDKMCSKCHPRHDVPARKIIARFIQRKITTATAICTDCHGQHHIEPPTAEAGQ